MRNRFQVGDRVVYTRDKYSSRPGPRAKNVVASRHGETYQYQVDKFWIVAEIGPNGTLVLRTRSGKEHAVNISDPRLRRASWFERVFKPGLFPSPPADSNFLPSV